MQSLPSETAATESYPDHDSCKENSVTHDAAQPSSPTDCQDDNDSLNKGDDTDVLPTPLESSNMPWGADESEMEPSLQNPELVTNGDHIVSEQVHQFDYPIASDDGSQSLVSPPPLPISDEYTQDDFASPTKLDGADGIPDLETTSDSDPKMDLPENQHLDDTSISDAVVLESEGVVPIQEYPEDKGIEQNPEIQNNRDEAYLSILPAYTEEHLSADGMLPPGSNDLPIGSSEPVDGEESLANDPYERESELENRNKSFKLIPAGQSFSSVGIPAPLLVSTASHVSAGQIVVPASVDPTQENAVAALQILKVSFMGAV